MTATKPLTPSYDCDYCSKDVATVLLTYRVSPTDTWSQSFLCSPCEVDLTHGSELDVWEIQDLV